MKKPANLDELYQDIDIKALDEYSPANSNSDIFFNREKQNQSLKKFNEKLTIKEELDLEEITNAEEQLDCIDENSNEVVALENISSHLAKETSKELSKETWISIEEFSNISGLSIEKIKDLITGNVIKSKQDKSNVFIDVSSGTWAIIKRIEDSLKASDVGTLSPVFVEKTIATILSLHDKVVNAKDETLGALKNENVFLKDALISMQDVYDDDKKTIEFLRNELQKKEEEVQYVTRKYKLMWGRVSNSTK